MISLRVPLSTAYHILTILIQHTTIQIPASTTWSYYTREGLFLTNSLSPNPNARCSRHGLIPSGNNTLGGSISYVLYIWICKYIALPLQHSNTNLICFIQLSHQPNTMWIPMHWLLSVIRCMRSECGVIMPCSI